jgi:purine-nucleoside phosphorylase
MPSNTPGSRGSDPFEQARVAARDLARRTGAPRHDVLVVLGTGLVPVAEGLGATGPGLDLATLPWFERPSAPGHSGASWSLPVEGRQVLVTAGRLHLYEGHDAHAVVHVVRTAIAAGCRTVVLTNAAGSLRAEWAPGTVVLIADHLNLTGASPLTGVPAIHAEGRPFVELVDAWSPRLRALARQVDPSLPEGVYAQRVGPHLETPAEAAMLRTLGADLVGMSTVPEATAARHLGVEILGLSVVTNQAASLDQAVSFEGILAVGRWAAPQLERIIRGVLGLLGPTEPVAATDRGSRAVGP